VLELAERCFAFVVAGFKQQLAYKLDNFISLFFKIALSLVMIFVWTAVFANTHAKEIGGFTLNSMYIYFFIVNAIFFISYNDMPAYIMQSDVKDGAIATALIKPVRYPLQLLFSSIAANLMDLVTFVLPFLAITLLIGGITISTQTLVFFIAEIILAYVITTLFGFLLGTLSVYFVSIWGILAVTNTICFLLGGGIMPLSIFPEWASKILVLLPISLSLYTPAATLLGMLSTQSILASLLVGSIWAVSLFVFSIFWWQKVSKRITSAGG